MAPGPVLPRTTDPLLICTDSSAPPKWNTILTRIRARGEVYPLQAPEYEGIAVDALLAANKKYKKHPFVVIADEESMKSADRAVLVVWAEKGGKAGDPERGDSFRCAPAAVPAVEKKLEEEGKKAWAALAEGVGGDGIYRG
ncbi:hypothetical protein I4F81_007180 [Pyropia yezoensis]|uniref:Uncharacterized protein n=1 Tax=Pyropia yezoensis TaxID=2788 RepID=A0ACC3C4G1_PYRYE|nr:hypothetical protein I4F81_007180 [Neopyropia yezoensis]|eukprot:contig_10128_g2420